MAVVVIFSQSQERMKKRMMERKKGRGPPAVKHEVDPLRLAATARDLTNLESRLTSERRCLIFLGCENENTV